MFVLHDQPVSASSVLPPTDNNTFLVTLPTDNITEHSWSLTTLSTVLTDSVTSKNVTSTWEPRRDPLYIVVPITVIYAVILLTGLVGNVSTCVVIARNKHMHTATNYYLFSLAVSDLLLLVSGLPQEMYYNWSRYPYVFGEAFCVLQGFAAETSANATVLTITAFTVERYVAICHPFQSFNLSKLSRAVRLVLVIWLLALGLAVPQALQLGLVYEHLPDGRELADHSVCAIKRVVIPHSFEISSFVFFVAPMTLISVLYALIGLQLRRSSLRGGGSSVRLKTGVAGCSTQHKPVDGRKNFSKNAQMKATKHVVKMLVAVVVAFFICWAPFHAQRLLAVYGEGSPGEGPSAAMVTVYHTLTYTSGVLYYLSTTVNPVLYHIMSLKFREAFKETLARYLGRRRSRGNRWQCYTVLSARHSATNNTSNCGVASLGRYLEADMIRLHESRRPIVVSFRRHRIRRQDSTGDSEVSGGSTSTGPEIYVSMEELTKNRSRFNSCKMSKLKKTRNKLNETYLSVICRHSKPPARGVRGKSAKEGCEKAGPYAGYTSSPNSSFPCRLRQDTQPESVLMSGWHTKNSVPRLPTGDVNISKEFPENLNGKDKDQTGSCSKSTKYPKVEDIEIFQEEHLKIQRSFKKQQRNSRNSRHTNKHKAQISSCNSFECSFRASGDRINLRLDAVRSGTASTTDGPPHCAVSRSYTLPSLRTATKDIDAHTAGLSVPSLRHTQFLQSRCDVLHNNFADGGYRVRSMKRFTRSETHRKYIHFDILGCDNISKSESNVRNVTASLREQNRNLNDMTTRVARRKLDDLSNYGVSNIVTSGAESSLGTESKLLSQKGKSSTIQQSVPEFPLVDEEVTDEKAGHCNQSSREQEQNISAENHAAPSPEDKTLALQNLSIFSAEGCSIQNENPPYGDISKTMEQFREYSSNTGVCNSTDSTPICICRPKSCSDLTLSARQNYQSLTSIAYSSSPRLTAGDLPV